MGRVADDQHLVPAQVLPEDAAAALMRHGGDLVALFVVVGEPAGLKDLPEIEVAQLDLRAEPDVAGEQAEQRRLRQRLQFADEFPHARTELGLAVAQDMVQPEDVTLEEPLQSSPASAQSGGS